MAELAAAGAEAAERTWLLRLRDAYLASLKPLSVEEPIDVYVHRPLAYVLARVALPTPITPNGITVVSILFGLAAGVAYLRPFDGHLAIAGACLFTSAVFDCADGQLARMRKTSSAFGRMLDGCADLVVSIAAVGGAAWAIAAQFTGWQWWVTLAACVVTAVTGSFHTAMYDRYKNVYLAMTTDSTREGEGYETALDRYRARPEREFGLLARTVLWPVYLFYTKSQDDYAAGFDPYTARCVTKLPAYTPERAAIYARHTDPLIRVWRNWFGFGSLVFGIAASSMLDVLGAYAFFRLIVLNAVYFAWLKPEQRRASRDAFAEIAAQPG